MFEALRKGLARRKRNQKPKFREVYLFESHLSALEKIGRFVGKTPAQLVTEGLDIYIESEGIEQGHQRSRVFR
jgi:hypothetical protein